MHEILAETDRKRSKMPFDKVRQYYLIKNHIKFGEYWMQSYSVIVLTSSKYTKF